VETPGLEDLKRKNYLILLPAYPSQLENPIQKGRLKKKKKDRKKKPRQIKRRY